MEPPVSRSDAQSRYTWVVADEYLLRLYRCEMWDMSKPLRPDFSAASVGLTLPAQHKRLGKLHDWLIDELEISPHEHVIALSNYQQGRFGRLPTHILLVTDQRVAYTHDGGLRSVPLSDIDTNRVGIRAGAINGEITLVLRSGEQLNFRRGMSLGMQEIANALAHYASGTPSEVPRLPRPNQPTATTPEPPPAPPTDAWAGRGDGVIQFTSPTEGLHFFRVRGGSSMEVFSVWALSTALEPQDLLVNTSEPYCGICVAGRQGVLGGLQINATHAWSIEPLDPESLPVFDGSCEGSGDSAIVMRPGLAMLDSAIVLDVTANSQGTVHMWSYGTSPGLLINTIGSYAGTIIVPEGAQFLAIRCDGNWAITQ